MAAPLGPPESRTTIVGHLTRHWSDAADRVCLDQPGQMAWTHAGVAHRVVATAIALADAGVSPGDRVVVQVPKTREAVVVYLATAAMGAVFVPVNPAAPPAELAFQVDDAQPSVLVLDGGRVLSHAAGAGGQGIDPTHRVGAGGAVTLTLDADGSGSLTEAVRAVPTADDPLAALDDLVAGSGRRRR